MRRRGRSETQAAILHFLSATDTAGMEAEGDRYVELAKRLGISDAEIDAALAGNAKLGIAADGFEEAA